MKNAAHYNSDKRSNL